MPNAKILWRDESGQMSVFIALIFQVLFVFFAMVVNIGLLVHDKINLQNAVDLGAYYAAERQSEILNEIAHINYQIRQDNKLLAWRYRVLGTLGRVGVSQRTGPPARKLVQYQLKEQPWVDPSYPVDPLGDDIPSVCVSNEMWLDFKSASNTNNENYCYQRNGTVIPPIPDVVIIAPFIPGVVQAGLFAKQAQQAAAQSCSKAAGLNWAFTMQMIYAYKLSIAARKEMIANLQAKLTSNDMLDRNLQSVKQGVLNTILNNLTETNRAQFDSTYFDVQNGLAAGGCASAVLGEVLTAPMLYFTRTSGAGGACSIQIQPQNDLQFVDPSAIAYWDPSQVLRNLAAAEPPPGDPTHSSLGFEKNPWCMAYMGVRARTAPQKPFLPFGPVTLEARSFAQPFGGRIGPWYTSQWPSGASHSSGGSRVDPLTVPRILGTSFDPTGGVDLSNPRTRIPNYSRFPGDTLGLRSELAMGAQRDALVGPSAAQLRLRYYGTFETIPVAGDPLAWDPDPQNLFSDSIKKLRAVEMAAVAPDLFDATYYSIEPEYFANYLRLPNEAQRFQGLAPILGQVPQPMPDIGGRLDQPELKLIQVDEQINVANNHGSIQKMDHGSDTNALPNLFYLLASWTHLLTGWAPERATTFTFPDQFGQCYAPADPAVMIPGKCSQGGRTGYSVRLISRDHLLSANWQIGGAGTAPGPILNPPDTTW